MSGAPEPGSARGGCGLGRGGVRAEPSFVSLSLSAPPPRPLPPAEPGDGPRVAGTPTRIVGSRVGRGVRLALTGDTRGGGCRVPGAARAGLEGVALLLTNCAAGDPLTPQVSVLHSQNGWKNPCLRGRLGASQTCLLVKMGLGPYLKSQSKCKYIKNM